MSASIDTQVAHIVDWQAKVETVSSLSKIISHVSAFKATRSLLEFSCVEALLGFATGRPSGIKRVEPSTTSTCRTEGELFWCPHTACVLEGSTLIEPSGRLACLEEGTAACQIVGY